MDTAVTFGDVLWFVGAGLGIVLVFGVIFGILAIMASEFKH